MMLMMKTMLHCISKKLDQSDGLKKNKKGALITGNTSLMTLALIINAI